MTLDATRPDSLLSRVSGGEPPFRSTLRISPRDQTARQVVRDHVETFLAHAASLRDGEGLPRFVDDEFRAFLRCGFLAGGFARLRCADCRTERLVAFS